MGAEHVRSDDNLQALDSAGGAASRAPEPRAAARREDDEREDDEGGEREDDEGGEREDSEDGGGLPPRPRRDRLGHYLVQRPLGRGGMGEVLLAWDERLERHVAIKRIRGDRTTDPRRRARFRREARAIARLSHPVIVQIYDLVDVEDGEAIVMEYVEGVPLARLLAGTAAAGGLDVELAIGLAAELAEGLAQAHAKGILHRDLKTENVMITPSGHVKLLDFGLAYHLAGNLLGEGRPGSDGALTESGVLVGTAHAMSPEQARGGALDHRSDLFALGGVIYAMLTGRPPFRGDDLVDTLHQIARAPFVAVRALRPEVPEALGALVERLLAKEPSERPASAQDVARTLARIARVRGMAVGTGRTGALAEELAERSTASAVTAAPALDSPTPPAASDRAVEPAPPALPAPRGEASSARPRRRHLAGWLAGRMILALGVALALVARFAYQTSAARAREGEARAQAERRRQEAEAVIRFTLVDLGKQLEPLGQLALLDAAGDRALAYFTAEPAREPSDGELQDRAAALHEIGQVRLAQNQLAEATPVLRQALRAAAQLAQRDPASSERQFELGQRYFWLGFALWQQKQLKPALEPFTAYLRISEELVTRDPRNRTWMLELAYAHSNLGSIHRELGELDEAGRALGAAAGLMETLLARAPGGDNGDDKGDDALRLELAHVQAKLGDLLMKRGELAQARPWLTRYLEALQGLVARAPGDQQRLRYLGYAHSHLGNLLRWSGELDAALAHYRDDLAIAERLSAHAPDDRALTDELALRLNKVADLLLTRGRPAEADPLLRRERQLVDGLLAFDAERAEWRLARARSDLTLAALLEVRGRRVEAIARAHAAAVAMLPLSISAPELPTVAVWLPYAWWRLGRLLAQSGKLDEARACWRQGLAQRAALAPSEPEPRLRDLQARLALALGRDDEAWPLLEALDRMGYREPELLAVRRERAAAPAR